MRTGFTGYFAGGCAATGTTASIDATQAAANAAAVRLATVIASAGRLLHEGIAGALSIAACARYDLRMIAVAPRLPRIFIDMPHNGIDNRVEYTMYCR
jgi:hypothetical protein